MVTDTLPGRELRLVKGYDDEAFPPARAYDAGLRERFAITLDTRRPGAEGMFFDVELFLRLLAALLDAIPYDRVVFEVDADGDGREPQPLEAACQGPFMADMEPPDQIILTQREQPVCVIETDCRVHVDGSEPYHDTYTISLYTKTDRADDFVIICEEVSDAIGAQISGYGQGLARREPFVPAWKRPLRWIGRKPW